MFFLIRIILLLTISSSLWAATYYRYENDQGQMVITQSMPPQYVHKGYEILNEAGRVTKVVPRALTEAELAAQSEEEKAQRMEVEQQEKDRRLLAIFSGPRDAERARDRKLEAIEVYINVTRGNILKLRGDLALAQEQAATKERAAAEVPDFLVEKMTSLDRQIKSAEESIVEKEAEKTVIRAEYAVHIERLIYLKKRRMSAGAAQE